MSKRSLLALVPSPFEIFANDEGYNLAPAVSLIPIRIYADRETQVGFDAFNAGARSVARMLTESTLETQAFREKLLELAK
jgi:hypothetical protein